MTNEELRRKHAKARDASGTGPVSGSGPRGSGSVRSIQDLPRGRRIDDCNDDRFGDYVDAKRGRNLGLNAVDIDAEKDNEAASSFGPPPPPQTSSKTEARKISASRSNRMKRSKAPSPKRETESTAGHRGPSWIYIPKDSRPPLQDPKRD